MSRFFVVVIILIMVCISPVSAAPHLQEPIQIDCTTGSGFAVSLGSTLTLTCPPCDRHAFYGDGTYSDDSSVCSAAAHTGVIQLDQGGNVTILTTEGLPEYISTTRNGLTSNASSGSRFGFQIVGGSTASTGESNTSAQGTTTDDAESKAALCTLLGLHQSMMAEEATRLNASLAEYNAELARLDEAVSLALDQYVTCQADCDPVMFNLLQTAYMRNYTQSQATEMSHLLQNNVQSQASNQRLQAALTCTAS